MAWCPNCKEEYRDGILICADCGATLIEKLPQEETENETIEEEIDKDSFIDFDELIEPVLLTTTSDTIQGKLIENILLDSEIRCFTKDIGCGTYLKVYMGNSIYGTEIYVNKSDFDVAKELVDAYFTEQETEDEYEPINEKDDSSFYKKKLIMKILIAISFSSPFIFLLFLIIYFKLKA